MVGGAEGASPGATIPGGGGALAVVGQPWPGGDVGAVGGDDHDWVGSAVIGGAGGGAPAGPVGAASGSGAEGGAGTGGVTTWVGSGSTGGTGAAGGPPVTTWVGSGSDTGTWGTNVRLPHCVQKIAPSGMVDPQLLHV